MPPLSTSTGLTITNPLVLYRALIATKRIDSDPAQHRLALHLQKLYYRLKDYEPEIEYSHRLEQISRTVGAPSAHPEEDANQQEYVEQKSVFSSFKAQREKADALALTRQLTSHESAIHLQSPQGLLLYGEVGTGKSMLVDLLADCLPNRKKRRWHFNTFMLETFARLEHLRRSRLTTSSLLRNKEDQEEEHSLIWLARDMISTSPILFLDEFQLPDRASSKILSNLLTSFFHLGGVLIATSNRMPEELANASGLEFATPPASRLGLLGNRWGLLGPGNKSGKSENMFAGKGDFTAFLDVLRARCEVWDIEGGRDWRRREVEGENEPELRTNTNLPGEKGFDGLGPMVVGNWGSGYEQSLHTKPGDEPASTSVKATKDILPKHYLVIPSETISEHMKDSVHQAWESAIFRAISHFPDSPSSVTELPWESTFIRIYGRNVLIPRHLSGVTKWTFSELCCSNLGPADYISLASTFHTLILTEVPVMSLLQKNEARRLITLLDALYEARCKLLIHAEAGPDALFFPEIHSPTVKTGSNQESSADGVYSETFSEIYQDQTSPFRPNISSYTSSASAPSYASSPPVSHSSTTTTSSLRSILADEDSDFGPVYSADRSSSPDLRSESSTRGTSDGAPGAGNEIGRQESPNFAQAGTFTGEDEKFAYKRARSRLWEMCGSRWWAREEEGWWRPVEKRIRRWEGDTVAEREGPGGMEAVASSGRTIESEEDLFRHGASPFRKNVEAPPKIGWEHAWGMMRWGKKAGAWGKGVEGLKERKRKSGNVKEPDKE
ncbi:hypothetical protein MMC12_001771 [Toensbergia leucococca]|nr:hypothetical protein [Toensbergia leucococca]